MNISLLCRCILMAHNVLPRNDKGNGQDFSIDTGNWDR